MRVGEGKQADLRTATAVLERNEVEWADHAPQKQTVNHNLPKRKRKKTKKLEMWSAAYGLPLELR